MIYIKDMEMPADCLACRISCKHETYQVTGRPEGCPLEEVKTSDLISRADAIEAVRKIVSVETEIDATLLDKMDVIVELSELPSAEAVHKPDYSYEADMVKRLRQAEAVQGEWIECLAYNPDLDADVLYIECDQCGHRPYFSGSYRPKYCEECGARMTKGGDTE